MMLLLDHAFGCRLQMKGGGDERLGVVGLGRGEQLLRRSLARR